MFGLYSVSQKSNLIMCPLIPPEALMSLIAASIPALRPASSSTGLLTEISLPTVIVDLLADAPGLVPAEAELELLALLPHAASRTTHAATASEPTTVRVD